MTQLKQDNRNWQLDHYAAVGSRYGSKHFTSADGEFTSWILEQIETVMPQASRIAEIGAGTCVFASLLGQRLNVPESVTCFEPVSEILEGAAAFENVSPHVGGAAEFAAQTDDDYFDFIFTKDVAHHFEREALDDIHLGIHRKLASGGRYLMVARTPPDSGVVPVGEIAARKWPELYTPLKALLASLRSIDGWRDIMVTRWEKSVTTAVADWLEGVRQQDTWSVFSALDEAEINETLAELETRFGETEHFSFPHQYDVAICEKL